MKCFQHKLTNTIPFINRFHLWYMYNVVHNDPYKATLKRLTTKERKMYKCSKYQMYFRSTIRKKKKLLNENDDKCARVLCMNIEVENDIRYSCDKSLLAEIHAKVMEHRLPKYENGIHSSIYYDSGGFLCFDTVYFDGCEIERRYDVCLHCLQIIWSNVNDD